ncbi:MAG: ATP-dependent sacrificial sulfur transferase LarE [Oscillospiraceae bacterium]|nr:ATP-dependent sacrificial sulfur transferase LarE [Oscillospiraceae bacterium]
MELSEFFRSHPRCALGFSGGADSAYLLYAAVKSGAEVLPVYVNSAFQPGFELEDAARLCRELDVELQVVEVDVLCDENIAENPENRCYFCKKRIFEALKEKALSLGYTVVIDGTNASDIAGDRPGMRALGELSVLSPLRDCGITKPRLRELSREAGLFTWDKPAYACLATRIPSGERITADKLFRIEAAENELFKMGFTDFRVRTPEGRARLQFPADQLKRGEELFEEISRRLSPWFTDISIDPNTR